MAQSRWCEKATEFLLDLVIYLEKWGLSGIEWIGWIKKWWDRVGFASISLHLVDLVGFFWHGWESHQRFAIESPLNCKIVHKLGIFQNFQQAMFEY
jgi:hypothetical protein